MKKSKCIILVDNTNCFVRADRRSALTIQRLGNLRHLFILVLLASSLVTACDTLATSDATKENERLILATTTSTYDSGLLDAILPDFEAQFSYTVEVIAVGTGQALALGESGDADILLVHAREREDAFVESGNGVARYDVMYNDFVIVGSEDNPANISGNDVAEAFTTIAESEANFISRGDDSGTHIKEMSIWEIAGIVPEGNWYQSAGQGMGAVLTIANEQQAYTLTDRGTYIARAIEGLDLLILLEGDPLITNPYGVIPVSQDLHPDVNFEGAQVFVEWITSLETQEAIANYQVGDQQLFFPDSEAYHEANN